jgi:hypothetical protein
MSKETEVKEYANKINSAGLAHAKSLLTAGKIDWTSSWDFDANDGNKMLGSEGNNWSEYSKYHLGYHPEIDDKETKAYYSFPFGKNGKLYMSAIRAIRQRAGQADANEIFKEAGILMDKLKEKEENMVGDHDKKRKKEMYEAEDQFKTEAEAEARAKAMGGKGTHSMVVDGETLYMPFPNHDQYLAAKAKIEEKDMNRQEVLTVKSCDCKEESCDCEQKEENLAELPKSEPHTDDLVASNDIVHEKLHKIQQTFNLDGIEIFSTGIWNGDKYTTQDLDQMVSNFGKTGFVPPVKLGHNEEQPEMKDGEPSLGYVDKIYTEGSKLLANFKELPKKVYEAIKRGNYKRVSSEIYWNYRSNDQVLDRVLKAVALLGSEIPAVTNLEAIEGLYAQDSENGIVKKHYQDKEDKLMIDEQGQGITLKEYQELQDKLKSEQEKTNKAEEKLSEVQEERKAERVDKFIREHKEDGKILPVFENELKALMLSATSEKVYSYTQEEKTIELSQSELIEKIVNSFPKMVEFGEISQDGEFVVDRKPYDNPGEEVDRRANLLITKGKAEKYSEALKTVLTDDEQLRKEYYENQ